MTPTRSFAGTRLRVLAAALGLAVCCLGPSSRAQSSYTWFSSGSTGAAGGTGTWDTTNARWTADGSTWSAWNNATNDTAVFAGTAGTVTLNTAITANGLTFATTGYTVTGNTITLSLAGSTLPTITTNAGVSATINSGLAGSNGLVKEGAGTLTFNSQKTYTGTTTINAGILSLTGGGGAAGVIRGTVNVNAGATLRLATNDATGFGTGSDRISAINVTSGTLDITTTGGGGQNQTFSNGTITLTGAAITGVNGSATNLDFFSGSSALTTLASSTTSTVTNVQLSIRQSQGLTITVADGAAATDLLVSSTIANNVSFTSAPLIKAGAGTLALAGINTYTGTTVINAGTFQLGNGGATGSLVTTTPITGSAGATLAFNRSNTVQQGVDLNNVIGGSINVAQVGSGTLVLSTANTYTGTTIAVAGTILASGTGNLPGFATTGQVVFNGGIVAARVGGSGWTTAQVDTLLASATKTGGALGIDTTNGGLTQWTAFTTTNLGPSLGLAKLGSGTLTLNTANTYTGTTTVAGGVLSLADSSALGGGGNLSFTGGTLQYTASNTVDYSARIRGSTAAISIDTNNQNVGYAGAIDATNTAGLTKTGAGTLTLSGSNSYGGTTTVSTGTLVASGSNSLPGFGSAGRVVFGGGTLQIPVDGTAWTAAQAGTLLTNATKTSGAIALDVASGSQALSTAFGGSINFIKLGSGTLQFTGANTYTGTTVVAGGRLLVSNSLRNTAAVTVTSGTAEFGATNVFVGGHGTALAASRVLTADGPGSTLYMNANMESRIGNVTLANGGVFTSDRGLASYDVLLADVSTGAATVAVTGTAAATMNGTGGIHLSGTQNFNVADATGDANTDLTVSLILGAQGTQGGALGGVNKQGAGTMLASGANTYTGNTLVSQGTLKAGNPAAFGAANSAATAVVVSAGATLDVNGQYTNRGVTISGSGVGGLGALVNTGTATDSNQIQTPNIALAADATIGGTASFYMINTTYSANALTLNNFTLTKSGSNTFFLANTTVSSGTVRISGGTLSQFNTASTGSAAAFVLDDTAGASLALNNLALSVGSLSGGGGTGGTVSLGSGTITIGALGTSTTYSGSIGGSGALIKVGSGTLTLAGTSGYSGATTISAGVLQLGGGGRLGTSGTYAGAISNAGLLNVASSAAQTLSGVISGTGALVKDGSGALTLSNASSSFSGDVTINSGSLVAPTITSGANTVLGVKSGSRTITVNSGATMQWTSNNVFVGSGGAASGLPAIVVNGGTFSSTQFNTIGNITLNNGAVLTQAAPSSVTYEGYQYIGTITVGGSTASTIASTNGKANHLLGGGTTAFNVADVTSSSAADLTVSNSIRDGSNDYTGVGALLKSGAGTMLLSGTSFYTGGTIVNAGVLDLGGVTAGGTGVIRGTATVNAGAVLSLSTRDATGYNTDASRLSVINLVGGTLAVNTGSNQTLGSGTLNLTGGFITGTSTGNIDFFGGASTLNSLASSTTSVISGVRLSPLRQGSTTFTVASGSAPGGIDLEIQSAMQTSDSGDAAGGQFIKAGAGTLRITGSVTYGGTTAISAGTLQVGGNGTTGSIQNATNVSAGALLAFNRSNAYTYSGTISGAGTISQIGSGTLTLTAANTYTGTTSLAAGVLSLGSTGALGSTGTISFSGGTLQFTGANTTDYAARIRNSSAAIQLDTNSQNVTFAAAVDSSNGSGLTKLGSGTLTLTAANSYAGNTTISAGVLRLGNGGASGSVAGTIVNNATLAVNRSDAYTLGNVISGSGGLVQAGSGTTTLSVVNSYSGATTVSGGMLSISQDANLGTAPGSATPGSIVISGGVLSASAGFTLDSRRGIALGPAVGSGTGTIDVAGALTTLTYAGVLADNAGGTDALLKTGLGTLVFAGTSTYSGNTSVGAGTLQVTGSLASPNLTVAAAASLAGTGAVNATTVSSGGILAPGVGGIGTLSLASVTFSGSATVAMGVQGTSPSTLLNVAGGVTTLGSGSSVAFAFGNSLNSIGTGTYSLLTYGGAQLSDVSAFQVTGNQGARQGVNLENGTQAVNLVITNAFPIWSGANGTVWTGSDNWVLSGGGGPTTFLPNDTVVFDDSGVTGTVTLTQNVDPATTTFSGTTLAYTLSGGFGITTGALVKSGPASLTISTSNSFTGGTTLSAGTILIGNDAAFGTGDVTVSGTASGITLESDGASPRTVANTLVVQNALTLGDPTNTGAITFTGTVNLGGGTRTITTLSNATFSGLVTNGGLVKAGPGALTITASNNYAGTTVSAGTLQVGNDAALGAGVVTLADGVTLSANSATPRSLANAFTINGNVTLGDAVNSGTLSLGGANGISLGGGTRQITTPSDVTFAGAVSAGGLVKLGNGMLTLAAANSYSGGTTLSAGVIALGNTGALGSGTLTVTGDAAVRTALTGTIANVLVLNSAVTGTFDAQSGTATLSGVVSGAGTFVKSGSGGLTLAGANTLSGTVSLSAGRLNLNTASALGTGILLIAGSSTLDNTSGGAVTLTGPNPQAWNADFTFAGSNALNLGAGAVTLGGNRQVTVTSSTLTVGGGIGGGFAFTKAGAGALSLTGAGNYSGGTTLSAGTLLVGNASALGTGTVALNAGTLFVNGVTAANAVVLGGGAIDGAGGGTLSGVLSGASNLSKTGTGTVALTGPSTFTGGVGITGGVLEASSIADGSASALGAGSGATGYIGIQNATFRYTGASSATSTRWLWVDLGAGTIDVQNAAATLTLNPGGGTRNQNFMKAGAGTLVLGGDITGGAAVTVSAGVLALTASNSYTGGSTVTGGTLQLGTGGTVGSIAGNVAVNSGGALAFNRSDAFSYSGLISGSGNVRQLGTGTTTLGGANTFSGVLTVAQGAVAVATINNASTSGALGNSANAVVLGSSNARGTLAYTGVTGTSSKAFTLATGGTGAIDVPTAVTLTLSGGIDGSGGFVKEGEGTLAFSSQKTYTGTTTVNAGVLSLTAGGAAAGVIRGVVNVNPGATFRLAANDATGFGTGSDRISAINVTSGTFDITTTGGGGQNQTLGNCVITLQGAAITGVSGTTTNLDFFQGSSALTTLASSATSTVTNVALAIRQTGGLTITVADGAADTDLLVASRIYSNGFTDPLIKAGAGRMTLTALNGLASSANTNINAGTLKITGTGQLYDAYAGTAVVTIASGATLELDSFAYGTNGGLGQLRDYGDARLLRGGTISVLGTTQSTGNNFFVANGFSGAFNMTQAGQTLTLSGNNNTNIAVGGPLTFGGAGNITVNEVIENNTGAGSIIKAGLGTLTFGTAMTYTGSTTINTGTFVLTGAGQLGSGNYAGAFTNNAAFVTSATANQTLSGVVSGAGSFTKSGAGTLTLSNAASSFTGGVSLSAGVLSFVSGGLGSSGTVSLGGGTLQWAAGNTSDLSSRLALVNSTTTTLDIGSNNVTLANGIGAGSTASLVKTGGGALTLSASNGFSGGLAVSAGSVLVGNDAALGSGAVSLANGVTLSSADTSARAIANAIAVNGDATLGDATNTGVLTFTGGMNLGAATRTLTTPSNVTIASAVSGAGGLTKAGAGSLTLSASNSYAGDTTINAGTLALSGAGDISASSAALVVIAANAGLDISAASGPRTIGELSGGDATSQVTLGGNTLRSVVSSLAGSFGGVISGSGGFTKAGTAAFELTNLQTFTGPATVEAGRLQLVDGGNLANASRIIVGTEAGSTAILEAYTTLAVVDGQTLGGYGTVTGDLAMLAGGVLSPGGSVGTLANTTGNTTFNGGMRYLFEVNNASGTPGSDPGWDLFTTTGGLALNITGTDQIFVDLTSLAGTSPGEAANFDPTFNYAWKFVVAGSTIGYEYALNPTWFQVTTGAFQNTTNGNFYVARGDQLGAVNVSGGTANELYVVYAAIPEPSTLALAGIGLAAAGWAASRRRRRRTR